MARKIQPRSKTPKPTRGQSSEDYWRERETRQRAANIHDEARYAARIDDIFQSTQDNIQQEIESFYQRYADKEEIDIAEARRRVSKIDMEKYERLAAQYVKAAHEGGREAAFSDIANEQMRLYNATMRINRLEMLKARCGIRAMEGYRLADQLINEALEERTYSEYYRLAGILGNTVQFNENLVRSIVNASYQNATWSQRLWNNQALLSERIGAQIAQGILTGKGSDVLARNVQKLTGQSAYNCQRLMRTELRRVQTAAAEQSMLDNGVTEYKFLVANGINPCDECLALDGKVFKISEMSVGKNAPPKHPLCHCCTCPAIDEEKWQRWLDGPAQAGVPWAEFENGENIAQYLVRSHNPGDNITKERLNITKAISGCPKKVQDAINAGTQIIVGNGSESGYDYQNDILYIAKGSTPEEVAHEIGHLIDKKLVSKQDRDRLVKEAVNGCTIIDVYYEPFYDNLGNKKDVLCVHSSKLISIYQGRTYVENEAAAFNKDHSIKIEPMKEFVAEIFREYWIDPNRLKNTYPEYHKLIEDAVK